MQVNLNPSGNTPVSGTLAISPELANHGPSIFSTMKKVCSRPSQFAAFAIGPLARIMPSSAITDTLYLIDDLTSLASRRSLVKWLRAFGRSQDSHVDSPTALTAKPRSRCRARCGIASMAIHFGKEVPLGPPDKVKHRGPTRSTEPCTRALMPTSPMNISRRLHSCHRIVGSFCS
jgi:hypothetical protein